MLPPQQSVKWNLLIDGSYYISKRIVALKRLLLREDIVAEQTPQKVM